MATLLFIDTNILLDFYRQVGQKEALSILKHIDDNHDKIITGSQVEMEYKKNRQRTISGCLAAFKGVDGNAVSTPAFLSHSRTAVAIKKDRNSIETRVKSVRRTVNAMLERPARTDPIYQVCQRLFKSKSSLNLSRDREIRHEIRELAQKRFLLGYPPRKDSDTSIGDAVNWEWIIRCAKDNGKDVVIASRDSDYGFVGGQGIINDWLAQEFKERVGRTRKVTLTEKLAEGLKLANITVSRKEVNTENAQLRRLYTTIAKASAKSMEEIIESPFYSEMIRGLFKSTFPRTNVDEIDT
jgi:hypothetical protein